MDCKDFNESLSFDTSNVVDISFMFRACKKFNKTCNFDIKNVINANYVFRV